MNAFDSLPPPARAADLCKYVSVSDDAKAALTPEMPPAEFLAVLNERNLIGDSLNFLAHLLPKRQAVFWAMSCARQSGRTLEPVSEAALKAAEKWIADPSESNRQACLTASNDVDASTSASLTALAAHYCTTTLPGTDPRVNSKAYFMTAKLVGGAVALAATEGDPKQIVPKFESFLAKGTEIYKRSTSGR